MKFDRNTVIGFLVMAVLFFGYFYYTNLEQAQYRKTQAREKAIQDSIANVNKPKVDTAAVKPEAARRDTITNSIMAGQFPSAKNAAAQLVYAENEVFRIAFTTKGGQPEWVELKNIKNQDSGVVRLAGTDFDQISYMVNTGTAASNATPITDLLFNRIDSVKNADGSTTYSFATQSSDSTVTSSITHLYTIKKNDYMLDFSIQLNPANKLINGGVLNLS